MNTQISALIVETIRLMTLSAPTKQQLQRMHQITAMITGQISAFETLMQMLVSSQPNATQKKAIITIMENLIRRQNKLGDFSKKMDKWKLHENLYAGLLHPAIQDSNKVSLQKMYVRVLYYDKNQEIKTDIVSKAVSFFQKLPEIQRQNSYLVKSMRHIVRALLHENLNKEIIHKLLSTAFNTILKQTINNGIMITEALKAKNEQAFSEKIQILAYSIQVLKLIYIKTDPQRFPVLKLQLLKNENISKLIFLCLEMRLPDDQPSLIIKTRGIQILKLINLSKRYAFEILVNGLTIVDKTKKWWNKQAYHNIYVISQRIISVLPPLIVKQLQNYPQQKLEDQDLIKETFKFIYYAIRAQCFYSIAEKYRDMIIFQMCINCLVTTSQLREKSPEDFIGFKEDVANVQQQNSLENKAAKIIQAYTDQIDGSITRITKACINVIQFQLTANPKYSQQLPQLLINSPFFMKFTLQDQISTCFMILAILSYQSKHRLDFVAQILDLFIRRREYLMNMDLNHEVRICYFICYSYYIDNFYQMCFSDRSKQQFHIAMIDYMITVIEKLGDDNLENNDLKQGSVLQSIDCLNNCLTQHGFVGALFLQQDASKLLANYFLRILNQLYGIYNVKIANLILDFFKGKVRAHFREGGRFQISPVIRQILAPQTAIKINQILMSVNVNKSMIRDMLVNILSVVLLVVNNPVFIYPNICDLFKNMHNLQEHKQKILDCIKVITSSLVVQYKDNAYLNNRKTKRQNQNNPLSTDNSEIVQEIDADYQRVNPKEMLIVVNQLSQIIYNTFPQLVKDLGGYGIIFGILQDFIQLNYQLQILLVKLKDFTMKCEDDEALQQYSLYLMLQIAQSRYISINKQTWQTIMVDLISFMQNEFVRRQKAIYGKVLVILLCCLQADFHYWLKVFKHENLLNIWKLLLANQKNYRTVTQQKIFVIKMISFINKYELEQKDLLSAIRMCSILTYFLHNGESTNWVQDLSQKQLSQDDDQQRQYWQTQMPIMSKNPYLSSLDNEVNYLRDICLKLLQVKGVLFKQFVQEMPIAIRNFIKNNVINYKDDSSGKVPLRKIYKVKTIKQSEESVDN